MGGIALLEPYWYTFYRFHLALMKNNTKPLKAVINPKIEKIRSSVFPKLSRPS